MRIRSDGRNTARLEWPWEQRSADRLTLDEGGCVTQSQVPTSPSPGSQSEGRAGGGGRSGGGEAVHTYGNYG